jgi:hypothetical protein
VTRIHRALQIVAAVLTAAVSTGAQAAAQPVSAAQLKAAYLFNFVQFVEWPAQVPLSGAPFVLCVVNDEAVASALEQTIKGRTAGGHSLGVRRLGTGAPLPVCHVLYFAAVHEKQLANVIGTLSGRLVLTVSDVPGFAKVGGMVELYREDARMRIAVNVDALQRSGVRLSSRVLQIATIVRDAPSP